jgi:hypothetical protein
MLIRIPSECQSAAMTPKSIAKLKAMTFWEQLRLARKSRGRNLLIRRYNLR